MRRCIALLLSGGTGSRLGAALPKQYIRTGGRMMITRSLHALFQCDRIAGVQIVADTAWHEKIREDWKRCTGENGEAASNCRQDWILGFSAPREKRQLSILNGLEDVAKQQDEDTIVLIHDAARPFVSAGILDACIQACEAHDGAMPVLPMKDTVYFSGDGVSGQSCWSGRRSLRDRRRKHLYWESTWRQTGYCCRRGYSRSRDRQSRRYWRGWILR